MSSKKVDERDELRKKTAQKDIDEEELQEDSGESENPKSEEDQEKSSKNRKTDKKSEKEMPVKENAAEEDLKTQYLRLLADYQNFKRRTEKEKSDIYAYANEKIALELLDVMDNFERAMAHTTESSDKNLVSGMTAIFKQLKDVLEKNGIGEIMCQGENFDPCIHHAVSTENSGEFKSGQVAETLQKGYTLKGKVIRPALVKVAE